ncbi:hypothetical protein EGW08_015054 [Elysia chlorotica]|uniref:Phospholipid scramblase n=1 Tax=Elysia chlorotica TaxID=188477 RepID=A0A433T6I6_ELYCH|nr:hypothetical protein EGW08_015054 [Elysia chlorotica]
MAFRELTQLLPVHFRNFNTAAPDNLQLTTPPGAGWAPCPPGLEYLQQVDQLLVKQKMEAVEAFTGFETNNKYEIRNSMGQRVYMAVEDTCCCTRNCCGSARPFDMKIMDNQKREVMHLSRPLRCRTCWCPCCLQDMFCDSVNYADLCKNSKKKKKDSVGIAVLSTPGGFCMMEYIFTIPVSSKDGETFVGQITKQWSGLAKEIFTDADNFGVSFPIDLDTKTKATLLGAVFLIDFMYFEHDSKEVKKEAKKLTD